MIEWERLTKSFGSPAVHLNYVARFVKPGDPVGSPGPGRCERIDGPAPAHLHECWTGDPWNLHSVAWWQRHRNRTGIMDLALADALPNGWRLWVDWLELIAPESVTEMQALEADSGSHLGYVRVVGRCRAEAQLSEPIVSGPPRNTRKSRSCAVRCDVPTQDDKCICSS
jgi:hypothetical protein